jgi:hypothetical protein
MSEDQPPVAPAPSAPRRPPRLLLHVGLFLATFLTTTAAGALFVHGQMGGGLGWQAILPISDGLSYSLPLMLILLSHELGHYLVARLHRLLPLGAVGVFLWVLHVVRIEAGGHWDQTIGSSIALGAAFPWLVWYLLIAVVRRVSGGVNHPPVDDTPLPASRRVLFWVMVAVFVGVFMPVPFRATFVGGVQPEAPAAPTASATP